MKTVNVAQSNAVWTGKKIGGSHQGSIQLKSGQLEFDGTQLVDGKFVIDMSSIAVTDLEGEMKTKLEGHLKSDDFFSTDTYTEAILDFTSVEQKDKAYAVTADLRIKGITKPIHFELSLSEDTATTNLVIDRSKYDVKYGSKSFFKSLGDNLIHDNFDVAVTLKF